MKDDKEDDTVRYKNTIDSHDNSQTNNNNNNNDISNEKNLRIKTREENKNIIDKLYDCGDELSIEETNFNYDINSNKKEKDKYNMHMFKFVDTDE